LLLLFAGVGRMGVDEPTTSAAGWGVRTQQLEAYGTVEINMLYQVSGVSGCLLSLEVLLLLLSDRSTIPPSFTPTVKGRMRVGSVDRSVLTN
jgi:hypothetical protein